MFFCRKIIYNAYVIRYSVRAKKIKMKSNDVRPIFVTDSGIGGLSVLDKLAKSFPDERFIYYSDLKNVPYGNKDKKRIIKYCKKRVELAKKYNAKLIVVACNTMSVIGEDLFSKCGIPEVGVCAASTEMLEKSPKPIVVFCTAATAKNLSIGRLSGIKVVGLPSLAKEIEDNIFDKNFIPECFEPDYGEVKTIVLGCTHYSFLKKQFIARFHPEKIVDGTDEAVQKTAAFLGRKICEKVPCTGGKVKFIGSGARKMAKVYKMRF